ncbi:glycosyltransferase family 2 protein [Leifsonia sp. AG29]|uniref:glycosyltransferase family 2 protein n=1 Tax=Leifsonia sp. AG29 TaxID=2598860 RepID=UPI00131BAA28|nr:glycosyltransferase family 2 protein [Leifsonia sp. AG29]
MEHQVAVVTRTRDRIVLLRRALDSIAAQTFRDFQLVVVNDGGDPAPVDELISRLDGLGDPIVVHNTRSVGREEAVNVGVRASDSALIAILDDDDTWAPGFLAATVSHLSSTDDGGVAVRCEAVFEQLEDGRATELRRERLRSDINRVTLTETLISNYVPPSSMVVRRSLFDELGGWDGELPVLADWHFTLKLLAVSTIGFVDGEPLAFWHLREAQDGALGNSVHAAHNDHVAYAPVVRDSFLRADAARGNGLGDALVIGDVYQRLSRQIDLARQDVVSNSAGSASVIAAEFAPLHAKLDALSAAVAALQAAHARSLPARLRRIASKAKSIASSGIRPSGRSAQPSPSNDWNNPGASERL